MKNLCPYCNKRPLFNDPRAVTCGDKECQRKRKVSYYSPKKRRKYYLNKRFLKQKRISICVICGFKFKTSRDSQVLCRNEVCNKEYRRKIAKGKRRVIYGGLEWDKKCVVCNKVFRVFGNENRLTCSKRCGNKRKTVLGKQKYKEKRKQKPVILKDCIICNRKFKRFLNKQKTCGKKECISSKKYERIRKGIKPRTRVCVVCKKKETGFFTSHTLRTCEKKECRTEYSRMRYREKENLSLLTICCPICEKEIKTYDTQRVFCSKKCSSVFYSIGRQNGYTKHFSFLMKKQKGMCNGCGSIKNPSVDRIIARKTAENLGWPEHKINNKKNLQILCRSCNSIKGDRGMDYLMNRISNYPK